MIKAAICEDSELDRDILRKIIGFLLKDRGLEYEIISYDNGRELVSDYKNHPMDIIFLDILMDDIDGIETGKLIRKMDNNVEIVYCTSSKDFAIAAYDVHAMAYLLKPYETSRIQTVVDYYLQKHPQNNRNFIEVKSKRRPIIIPYKDILHMESDNKVVYIYTIARGIVKVYNKLDAFENELSDSRFLRCHQSYLVNMQYVIRVEDSDFIMSDDHMIPIRKSGRRLIVKKYEDYLKQSYIKS